VPLRHSVLPGARMRHGQALEALLREFPADVRRFYPPLPSEPFSDGSYRDGWGVIWKPTETREWLGVPVGHPLEDLSELQDFRWPDATGCDWATSEKAIEEDRGEHYLFGDGGILFELFQYLRGYENALVDLIEDREHADFILDKIVAFNLEKTRRLCKLGVDAVGFGDDWGTQRDLIISPELWRKHFKPRYKRMFDAAHEGGAFVHFHSDGNITKIIPDLIELGVNVLNPQLPVMDLNWLSKELKGEAAVRGGLDRQQVLPFGTPDEVRRHVREVFNGFGDKRGGWIGDGELNADVPLENARAMFEAIRGLM